TFSGSMNYHADELIGLFGWGSISVTANVFGSPIHLEGNAELSWFDIYLENEDGFFDLYWRKNSSSSAQGLSGRGEIFVVSPAEGAEATVPLPGEEDLLGELLRDDIDLLD